ncbi:MAG: hypothetical protein ACTHQQ_01325 [Solirubrobacteraceae bacterium]
MQPKLTALIRSPRTRLGLRVLGAVLVLFVGADHYYEYSVDSYSVLPTIGTLFLLNFISATAIGLILLAPLDRILHRFGNIALQLATLSGFGLAATSLVALLVSEHTKLFGFMESNYRPAIIVAIALEAATAILLALLFVVIRATKPPVSGSRATLPKRPARQRAMAERF